MMVKGKAILPTNFVYVDEIDSTIICNLRYASDKNFLGYKVFGYNNTRAILTKDTANALSSAQKDFLKDGYSIVIYDAYRPQKAVDTFMKWSKNTDETLKAKYYPTIDKSELFKRGYIVEKSGHTRGSTVDVSIIKINNKLHKIKTSQRKLNNGEIVPFLDDGTEDMYTSFDLFHEASHHNTSLIGENYLKRRNYLKSVMKKSGFLEYPGEWWHYTLENESFPNIYFDFDVE
jgi:D-alanyl-D-alanine dipeptidase